MAKKASASPSLQVSESPSLRAEAPSLPASESPSLPTEPTDQEITDLVRQSHGGISRKMAHRILTERKQATAN